MLTFTDDGFRAQIADETGIRAPWAAEAFNDVDADVRQCLARIKASPFIPLPGCGTRIRVLGGEGNPDRGARTTVPPSVAASGVPAVRVRGSAASFGAAGIDVGRARSVTAALRFRRGPAVLGGRLRALVCHGPDWGRRRMGSRVIPER
jgi:hypothetical protein